MKRTILLTIPVYMLLLMAPVTSIKAEAVTVDIVDNYDAGLLGEESDPPAADANSGDTASTEAAAADGAATNAAGDAANTTTAATEPATPVTPAATEAATTTQTNDLPRTGDDNRILITFTVMLTSFAVFVTTLLAGKMSRNK